VEEPQAFEFIFPIATNAFHSAWGKAFNASQRFCIELDESWRQRSESAGLQGMKVARSVALLSYRSSSTYNLYQADTDQAGLGPYRSQTYQEYQGEKLAKRFNAFSYYTLSRSMDSHQLGRGRSSTIAALKTIRAHALVIGIESDLLFPLREQIFLGEEIPGADFAGIPSVYGHDGFLLEAEAIALLVINFIKNRAAPGLQHPAVSDQREKR